MFNYNYRAYLTISEIEIQEVLFTYLDADPKKVQYISAIPATKRNKSNGYANIEFNYIDKFNEEQKKNIRIENNVFRSHIYLDPVRAHRLENADLIVFYDTKSNELFISDKTLNNNNAWLKDKSVRSTINSSSFNKEFYDYNIEILLNKHAIFQISIAKDKFYIIHDDSGSYFFKTVIITSSDRKSIIHYPLLVNRVKYVPCDLREREPAYFCFYNESETHTEATLMGLAEKFYSYTDLSKNKFYKKLYDASKNNTYVSIPLKSQFADKRYINNGNFEIGLSTTNNQSITRKVNKTENMKEYQKNYGNIYRKVKKYKKTHTEPKNSWTQEEKELFYKI